MEKKPYRILAVNPGSTSTKIALYEGRTPIRELTLRHSSEELAAYPTILDQFPFRRAIILDAVREAGVDLHELDAVIGRGGLLKPIPSGVYEVDEALCEGLRNPTGQHASNLGGLLAADLAREAGARAFIADPVVVDELEEVARLSGLPGLERVSIFHALNQKVIARTYAAETGRAYEELDLIVAHLGGGISVGAHHDGRVVDVNNALDGEGPFSPERAGTLPAGQLVDLALSGRYTAEELHRMFSGKGGLVAHLGTNSAQEVIRRAEEGDCKARSVIDAMCYGIGKTIGAMAAVLEGHVDAILLTGGIAYNAYVCRAVERMTGFIAPIRVYAGENELEALAFNALRVLDGETEALRYRG